MLTGDGELTVAIERRDGRGSVTLTDAGQLNEKREGSVLLVLFDRKSDF